MRDAAVHIVPYDPSWPAAFVAERDALEEVLQPWLIASIEHIGSTAVPGLAAKPVIDLMAPVRTLEAARAAVAVLAPFGYQHFPYKADVMLWFCKPSPEHRTHHLHLVPQGSPLWAERLGFRDALRADARLRRAYGDLKQRLATQFTHDREAYTEAKSDFIRTVVIQ